MNPSAESLSQEGRLPEALRVMDAAIKRRPDASLFSQRARIFSHNRAYVSALRDMGRAIKLKPRDAALYSQRSELLAALERPVEARRDIERAVRLAPEDEGLRKARLRHLALYGRPEAALKEISRSRGADPEILYYRGCLNLRSRRMKQAEKDFGRILGDAPPDGNLARRSRFYWTVAKTSGADFKRRHKMSKPEARTPGLYLIGLGLFPPYTTTVEVLHALGTCDVVFNNISGPEVREFLAEFCGDVRPATYDNLRDENRWLRRIALELKAGRKVAFVTRGHPMVFGALAGLLVSRCRKLGVECKAFAAVSSIDVLLAYSGQVLGREFEGIQAFNRPAVEEAQWVNTAHPLLVYFYDPMGKREVERFQRSLERFYPPELACWVFGPKYDSDPAVVTLGALAKDFPAIDPSRILYLPPLKAVPRRRERRGRHS